MRSFEDRVAVITGAASGIGAALAEQFARRGAELAICDVDEDGLSVTAETCRGHGAKVHVQRLDVADRGAVVAYADTVEQQYGRVNLLVNNAGVALTAHALEQSFDDIDWLLGINLHGVINGTQAFLPRLVASGEGHLVNISSAFGLFGVPHQSIYNAAKFGVRGYTESIAVEMGMHGHPVGVTCVHPGGIRTSIAKNARGGPSQDVTALAAVFDKIAMTSPEQAAATIVHGIQKGRRRVLVGRDAWAMHIGAQVLGVRYLKAVERFAGRAFLRPTNSVQRTVDKAST
jgi:NADP-dependent 3-hydroxy acid dehydrogenase YdfG